MWQLLKRTWWVWLCAGGIQSASAFSMLGNFDDWQVDSIAYQTRFSGFNEGPAIWDDAPLGGPMNLGEEFRYNIPILNYAFDQSFLDYFGSNGVYAVEQAFAILNNISNVSSYSSTLAEVPLEATRLNYRASALGLLDLKSAALHFLVEQMGLADPVRYTWTLRARALPPGAECPAYDYLVIKRNFNPITWEPSSYVNATLYSYFIGEFCPDDDQAEAFETRVDPLSQFYTAVASPNLWYGSFFTGLTRDDVGGLRYLLRTNNINFEGAPLGSTVIAGGFTNTNLRQLLTTSNLATLVFQSLTNSPAALQALYPGLILTGNTTTFTNVVSTNVISYFTNFPYSPAGSPASLVVVTNYSTNVEPRFHYTFGNVVTNHFYTNGIAILRDTTVGPAPFAPSGSGILSTNSKDTVVFSPVTGDYYLLPPDLCGYSIVNTQLVTVFPITNNVVVSTNDPAVTNLNSQSFSRDVITYFTNYILVVDPIECPADGPALHAGIEKVTFARRSFDSLLGQFFDPVTNRFQLTMVTNNLGIVQTYERIVTQPDILISADDLVTDPTVWPFGLDGINRTIIFNANNALPNLPGPGLIEPTMNMTFNKVGPAFFNSGPFFIDEASSLPSFVWGSFDGSTNAPVIYPSGTSIVDYESQVLMQVTTTSLSDGAVGVAYGDQLQGSGGQPPYSWSLAAGSTILPPGLTLASSGSISGTPTEAGTFKFTVILTESGARSVAADLSIKINP